MKCLVGLAIRNGGINSVKSLLQMVATSWPPAMEQSIKVSVICSYVGAVQVYGLT
jgi:hypothetical protein